jgi:hypothetical protein
LLVCGECGARFIARNQRSYKYASRIYGGPSARSNQIVVPRESAEPVMVNYLPMDLLSHEAIGIAKREYQDTAELDTPRAERGQLRKMLKAQTPSPAVVQAALDAVAINCRKAAATVKMLPSSLVKTFSLTVRRFTCAVKTWASKLPRASTRPRGVLRFRWVVDQLQLLKIQGVKMVAGAGFEPATFGL